MAVLAGFGIAAPAILYATVFDSPSVAPFFAQPIWAWPVFAAPFAAVALMLAASILTIRNQTRGLLSDWSFAAHVGLSVTLAAVVAALVNLGLIAGI